MLLRIAIMLFMLKTNTETDYLEQSDQRLVTRNTTYSGKPLDSHTATCQREWCDQSTSISLSARLGGCSIETPHNQ
jgi:hypothetical protein